jgi:hypothetical protein
MCESGRLPTPPLGEATNAQGLLFGNAYNYLIIWITVIKEPKLMWGFT